MFMEMYQNLLVTVTRVSIRRLSADYTTVPICDLWALGRFWYAQTYSVPVDTCSELSYHSSMALGWD